MLCKVSDLYQKKPLIFIINKLDMSNVFPYEKKMTDELVRDIDNQNLKKT